MVKLKTAHVVLFMLLMLLVRLNISEALRQVYKMAWHSKVERNEKTKEKKKVKSSQVSQSLEGRKRRKSIQVCFRTQ